MTEARGPRRRLVGLVAGPLVFAVVLAWPLPGLSPAVVIAAAQSVGVSPVPPALGASFGFMLPVSTPPNASSTARGSCHCRRWCAPASSSTSSVPC
jgi:di/tricarboxylate transporter